MIEICHLTKKFDGKTVLEDFSYSAEKGVVCGVVGYNGAGKTTLLKTVAGIYRADAGEIRLGGERVYENEKLKRRLFMVQDEPYFSPQSSIRAMCGFYKGYYPAWSDQTCYRLAEIFGLDPQAKLNGFSKGMQRQAALILGLSALPDYLLLDESFDGLDLTKRNLVKNILLEYIKHRGTNILITSHNLQEMEGLCDYIGIIKSRNLAYISSVEEMRKKRTKIRLIFAPGADIGVLQRDVFRNPTISGCMATFLYEGKEEELQALLTPLNILHIETVPMTLEEIFLEENEEKAYDFAGLF